MYDGQQTVLAVFGSANKVFTLDDHHFMDEILFIPGALAIFSACIQITFVVAPSNLLGRGKNGSSHDQERNVRLLIFCAAAIFIFTIILDPVKCAKRKADTKFQNTESSLCPSSFVYICIWTSESSRSFLADTSFAHMFWREWFILASNASRTK